MTAEREAADQRRSHPPSLREIGKGYLRRDAGQSRAVELVGSEPQCDIHFRHPPACGTDLSDGSTWTGSSDRVTCADCKIAQAVIGERERIRQLAIHHNARVDMGPLSDPPSVPFADLIGTGFHADAANAGTEARAAAFRADGTAEREWLAAGRAAEREHVRQLATERGATYPVRDQSGVIVDHPPFADLIGSEQQ